jgi:hypothetical protein
MKKDENYLVAKNVITGKVNKMSNYDNESQL